jgi:hypothetical protein
MRKRSGELKVLLSGELDVGRRRTNHGFCSMCLEPIHRDVSHDEQRARYMLYIAIRETMMSLVKPGTGRCWQQQKSGHTSTSGPGFVIMVT